MNNCRSARWAGRAARVLAGEGGGGLDDGHGARRMSGPRVPAWTAWLFASFAACVGACAEESKSYSTGSGPQEPHGGTVGGGSGGSSRSSVCDPFEPQPAPAVVGCGGIPVGQWRLASMEFGPTDLMIDFNGIARGSCDYLITSTPRVPSVLMDLREGGGARYAHETFTLEHTWSNSCVTGKASPLRCSDDIWDGVRDCGVSCDLCICRSGAEAMEERDSWRQTDALLTLSVFGEPLDYAYCLDGDRLQLSAEGTMMEFERVQTDGAPTPCDGLTVFECEFFDEPVDPGMGPVGTSCSADVECASGNCCVSGGVPLCSEAACERTVPGTICSHDLDCETLDCQVNGLCAPRGGVAGQACTSPADCANYNCCLGECTEQGSCSDGDFGTPCLGDWECLTAVDCRGSNVDTGQLGYCSRACSSDFTCTNTLGSQRDSACITRTGDLLDAYCVATCASQGDCEAGLTCAPAPDGDGAVCDR